MLNVKHNHLENHTINSCLLSLLLFLYIIIISLVPIDNLFEIKWLWETSSYRLGSIFYEEDKKKAKSFCEVGTHTLVSMIVSMIVCSCKQQIHILKLLSTTEKFNHRVLWLLKAKIEKNDLKNHSKSIM